MSLCAQLTNGGALMTDGNTLKQDRAARRQFWQRHIRAWRDSGLSQVIKKYKTNLTYYKFTIFRGILTCSLKSSASYPAFS